MQLKNKYLLFLVITWVVILNGCKTTEGEVKKTTQTKVEPAPKDEVFEPFYFSLFTKLSVSNVKSLYVYNSTEIKLSRSYPGGTSKVENGEIIFDNLNIIVDKLVPRNTIGVVDSISPNKKLMFVSFSKTEDVYKFWFEMNEIDGQYHLSSNKEGNIKRGGYDYNVTIDSTTTCVLRVKIKREQHREYQKGKAEGDDGT